MSGRSKIGEARNAMIENPMLSTSEVLNRTVGMLSMNANLHTPATKTIPRGSNFQKSHKTLIFISV